MFNCSSNNLFKIVKNYKIRTQYLKMILYQFVSDLTCKSSSIVWGSQTKTMADGLRIWL